MKDMFKILFKDVASRTDFINKFKTSIKFEGVFMFYDYFVKNKEKNNVMYVLNERGEDISKEDLSKYLNYGWTDSGDYIKYCVSEFQIIYTDATKCDPDPLHHLYITPPKNLKPKKLKVSYRGYDSETGKIRTMIDIYDLENVVGFEKKDWMSCDIHESFEVKLKDVFVNGKVVEAHSVIYTKSSEPEYCLVY